VPGQAASIGIAAAGERARHRSGHIHRRTSATRTRASPTTAPCAPSTGRKSMAWHSVARSVRSCVIRSSCSSTYRRRQSEPFGVHIRVAPEAARGRSPCVARGQERGTGGGTSAPHHSAQTQKLAQGNGRNGGDSTRSETRRAVAQ
jgi:hypothetical protein